MTWGRPYFRLPAIAARIAVCRTINRRIGVGCTETDVEPRSADEDPRCCVRPVTIAVSVVPPISVAAVEPPVPEPTSASPVIAVGLRRRSETNQSESANQSRQQQEPFHDLLLLF